MANGENWITPGWSYSKAILFESCPRAFYFSHVSSEEGSSTTEEETPQPSFDSVGSLIGIAVHRAIEHQIDRWKADDHTSMKVAQAEAEDFLRSNWDRSEVTEGQGKSNAEDEPEIGSIVRTVKHHHRRFFQVIWPQYRWNRYILHEETRSFRLDDRRVWVRVDLCTRDSSGNLVITDWKTTQPDVIQDESLQLGVYGLWAHRTFESDLNRIKVHLAYTSTGKIDRTSIDRARLESVMEHIESDYKDWKSRTTFQDFPPKPTSEKCSRCPHLDQCEEGQSAVRE